MNERQSLVTAEPLIQNIESEDSQTLNPENGRMNFKSRAYSFSNLRESQFRTLSFVSQLSFFGGLYRRINESSLRILLILWTRLILGAGVLVIPYYAQTYGLMGFLLVASFASLITVKSSQLVLQASIASRKRDFYNVNEYFLPRYLYHIFKITYFFDLMLPLLTYSILSWNLFQYVITYFGYGSDEWIHDAPRGMYNDFHPTLLATRAIYFGCIFMLLTPFFLKQNFRALGVLTVSYLLILICALVWLIVEAPFYRKNFGSRQRLFVEFGVKFPQLCWVTDFFSLLPILYVQSTILTFQKEIVTLSIRSLKVICRNIVLTLLLAIFIFSSIMYTCFGDENTPLIMLMRLPIDNFNPSVENAYKSFIIVFMIFNIFSLPTYIVPVQIYLQKFDFMSDKQTEFQAIAMLLLSLCCTIPILVPNLHTLFWFFGVFIVSINGLFFPLVLKLRIILNEDANKCKILWCCLGLLAIIACIIVNVLIKTGTLKCG